MRKKKKIEFDKDGYQGDGPANLSTARIIPDFLPSADELAKEEETIKVTLELTKRSVEKFKKLAKLHNTKYQRMIRNLVDEYISR